MKMRCILFFAQRQLHVASGLFVFISDALMPVVHPAHVMRIEPLTHADPSATVFWVFASIPAA
jgi:hypothetical protein